MELPVLKGSEIFNEFETETVDIKDAFRSLSIEDKREALIELLDKMSMT